VAPARRPLPERCTVEDLIGIPFERGGRDLTGIDCLGLWLAFQNRVLGKCMADPWDEQLAKMHAGGWRRFTELVPAGWVELPLDLHELRTGDTLMTARRRGRKIAEHLAPLVEPGRVLTTAERLPLSREPGVSYLQTVRGLEQAGVILSAWRHR